MNNEAPTDKTTEALPGSEQQDTPNASHTTETANSDTGLPSAESSGPAESASTESTVPPTPDKQPSPPAGRRMNPYLAGMFIGLAMVLTCALTGTGLHISHGLAPLADWIAATLTASPEPALATSPSVLMLSGSFGGGFLFSLVFGGFSLRLERGAKCTVKTRALLVLFGGLLSGFALRAVPFAGMDTALSGTALLLTGPALFLAGFAVSGFILTNIFRRQWND